MIDPDQIDNAIEDFSSGMEVEGLLENLNHHQSPLYAALFSEDSDILISQEKDYYCFLVALTWFIVKPNAKHEVSLDEFSEKAEKNWELLERHRDQIDQLIDAIYDDYPEPHMLDFLDDMLQAESTGVEISQPGARYFFVMTKSMVDAVIN